VASVIPAGTAPRRARTPARRLTAATSELIGPHQFGQDGALAQRLPICVLLADAHQLLARSLALILSAEPAIEVLGTAATADETLSAIRVTEPDVVLVSYFLLHAENGRLATALQSEAPGVKVLVLIAAPDSLTVSQCIEANAVGCISRDQPPEVVVDVIRRAYGGEMVFPSRALVEILAGARTTQRDQEPVLPPIRRREREVLQALASGASVEETADRLSISAHTVRTHLKNAMAKLAAHSRLEAVLRAHKLGLIDLTLLESSPNQATLTGVSSGVGLVG
jgi:DNA-binding NarL/FixJ family response regulator